MKNVRKGPAEYKPGMSLIMIWRQTGDKLLSEPVMPDILLIQARNNNLGKSMLELQRRFNSAM